MSTLAQSIINTLIYSDIFDFPLTLSEIHQRLLYFKCTSEQIETLIKGSPLIGQKAGYYFLGGREKIVDCRLHRTKISQDKLRKVNAGINLLRFVPWIKMVAVTGSLAVENAQLDADIDLLIVTNKNRLWVSRLLATVLLDVFGLRRKKGDKNTSDKICLNMFLDETRLVMTEKDIYSAYEIIQLKPIWWKENTYYDFMEANSWLLKTLPNFEFPPKREFYASSTLLPFPFLKSLEKFMYSLQYRNLSLRGNEFVSAHEIRFHPLNTRLWVLNEFNQRTHGLT